jgi:hypothetical protein
VKDSPASIEGWVATQIERGLLRGLPGGHGSPAGRCGGRDRCGGGRRAGACRGCAAGTVAAGDGGQCDGTAGGGQQVAVGTTSAVSIA